MLGRYEYTREPRRQLGSSDHVVLDQARATKQLITREGDEGSRNLAMTTGAFKPSSSILYCLVRSTMPPLRVQPARECRYEIAAISKVIDGHTMTECGLTRHKISDRARVRAWPQTGRTSYSKVMHRSGARFAVSPG